LEDFKMAGPLGTDKGAMKAPAQSSSKLATSVGSGSRPGSSRFPIDTSAPMDPYKLDGRGDTKGYLGSGSEKARG
jgi:hypothetical protein